MSSAGQPHPVRGEVYWLDFDPATGAEMRSLHPCVVVQNDRANRLASLTIVAAITSNLRVARLPVAVLLPAGTAGLPKASVVHGGHVYSVDRSRLGNKLGDLPPLYLAQVDAALRKSLDL